MVNSIDFNDVRARLDRMHHTIGNMEDFDVQAHVRPRTTVRRERDKTVTTYEIDFRAKSRTDAHTIALQAIASIASLKDHLKTSIKTAGGNPNNVDALINGSANLSLALDIWNLDKHGYPLKRPPRSGFHPQLRDIERGLTSYGPKGSIEVAFVTGEVTNADSVTIKIEGKVCDENGTEVISLSDLIAGCLSDLEVFISRHLEIVKNE